jgi:hypothetical protein
MPFVDGRFRNFAVHRARMKVGSPPFADLHHFGVHDLRSGTLNQPSPEQDDDPHRQPFAFDQDVDPSALHLIAGIVTRLVVATAPFSADLTDWLSRTAAEGRHPGPPTRRHMRLGPDRFPGAAMGSAAPTASTLHPSTAEITLASRR